MIIQVKNKTESIEVKLPAFFADSVNYYAIRGDETIILLDEGCDGCLITTWAKNNLFHSFLLQEALKCKAIEPEEFYKMLDKVIQHLEQIYQSH